MNRVLGYWHIKSENTPPTRHPVQGNQLEFLDKTYPPKEGWGYCRVKIYNPNCDQSLAVMNVTQALSDVPGPCCLRACRLSAPELTQTIHSHTVSQHKMTHATKKWLHKSSQSNEHLNFTNQHSLFSNNLQTFHIKELWTLWKCILTFHDLHKLSTKHHNTQHTERECSTWCDVWLEVASHAVNQTQQNSQANHRHLSKHNTAFQSH